MGWIQIRKRDHDDNKSAEQYIQELLGIPESVKVESIIAIGYSAEKRDGVKKEDLDFVKIRNERY